MSRRIRSIKPELLEDAVTAGLSDTAFRLFVAVILMADDYGRFRAESGLLGGTVWWRVAPSIPVADAVTELSTMSPDAGGPLVRFYFVEGQRYGEIRNWAKHQVIARPGKPRIPAPPDSRRTLSENILQSHASARTDLDLDLDLDLDREGDQTRAPDVVSTPPEIDTHPRTSEVRVRTAEPVDATPSAPASVPPCPPPPASAPVATAAPGPAPPSAPAAPVLRSLVPLAPDAALTPKHREILDGIAMTSGATLDVEFEWQKFAACAAERAKVSADWLASWRKWCLDAVTIARRERSKNRFPDAGRQEPPRYLPAPKLDYSAVGPCPPDLMLAIFGPPKNDPTPGQGDTETRHAASAAPTHAGDAKTTPATGPGPAKANCGNSREAAA